MDQKTENRLTAIEHALDDFQTRLEKIEAVLDDQGRELEGEEEI